MSQPVPSITLPPTLTSKVDMARLLREIEAVDADLESQKVRGAGAAGYRLPAISDNLDEFLTANQIDLADDDQRAACRHQLKLFKEKAPVVHLTFSTAIDPQSKAALVAWIRQEIQPLALIEVGLQPALIGGVYVRTPTHVYDLSMRSLFQSKTDILVRDIEGLI